MFPTACRGAWFPLLCALGACASTSAARGDADGRESLGYAIVLPRQQLPTHGGTLLDALVGRVSGMRVDRRSGRCPIVQLRGQRTILGSPNPRIYVDATPMTDTCILHQIPVADVERVELYPGGITNRAGYTGNPNGLIIVFLIGADG